MRSALFVLGFLGAGLVGGLVGRMLAPPPEAELSEGRDLSRLTATVEDLKAEVARLSEEQRLLAGTNPLLGGAAVAGTRAESPPAMDDAARAAMEFGVPGARPADPLATSSLTPDEMIEEKVRETVVEIAREDRVRRAKAAEAAQREKELKWLRDLKPKLGLTDFQIEEMSTLMIQRRQAIAAHKRQVAALGDNPPPSQRAPLDQALKDYGETLKTELQKVLSPDQYEAIMNPKGRGGNQGNR
jgi:hypothetical protein